MSLIRARSVKRSVARKEVSDAAARREADLVFVEYGTLRNDAACRRPNPARKIERAARGLEVARTPQGVVTPGGVK
jgi:hypothetical protein